MMFLSIFRNVLYCKNNEKMEKKKEEKPIAIKID
jgi:hypothetical protein